MSTTTVNGSFFSPSGIVEAETYEQVSNQVITLTRPYSVAAEQFRVLRYRLELFGQNGIRSLAFTSAQSSEGRTTVAVNAALALGRGGRHRVALVDADLRGPAVHKLLGLKPREGLCDIVAGRADLDGCLWRFGKNELAVLPAGNVPHDLEQTLFSPRLGEVMAQLKSRFDYLLVDAPPVLPLADVPILCRDLDGALMVVRAGVTPRELMQSALTALHGAKVHGVILNDVDPRAVAPLQLPATSAKPRGLLPAKTQHR